MTAKKKTPLVIYEDGTRYVIGEAYVSVDDEGKLYSIEARVDAALSNKSSERARALLNVYAGPIPLSIGSHSAFGEIGIGWTPEMGIIFAKKEGEV